MSVSFPHRCPFPAQPIPHWQDKWNSLETDSRSAREHLSAEKSNLTRDGSVSFYDTLSIDITGVGQTVATADLRLTALHLIACESRLTAATVIGALCGNYDSSVSIFEEE